MVLKEPWLLLILHELKTVELRGRSASPGPTWLASNGTIYGEAIISDCALMTPQLFERTRTQHLLLAEVPSYKKLYAITLSDVRKLDPPTQYYQHPASVQWTTFRTGPDCKVFKGKGKKRRSEVLQSEASEVSLPETIQEAATTSTK